MERQRTEVAPAEAPAVVRHGEAHLLDGGDAAESDLSYVQDKGTLVVGITYEFNRWVGRHVQDSRLAKILTAPGMWMQNFTTNEPDEEQLAVAIAAINPVLPENREEGRW